MEVWARRALQRRSCGRCGITVSTRARSFPVRGGRSGGHAHHLEGVAPTKRASSNLAFGTKYSLLHQLDPTATAPRDLRGVFVFRGSVVIFAGTREKESASIASIARF